MKKLLMCLMVIFLFVAFTPVIQPAFAVSVNVDLEDLPEEARNAILDAKAGKDKEPITVDTIMKWETAGVALGKALNALVKELGITVNEFIKTPVGKLSAGVLIWKIVLYDILILFLKLSVMLITGLAIAFSFMRFHVPHKKVIKDPEDKKYKEVKWVQKYSWTSGEAQMVSVGIHVILVGILVLILFTSI